MMTDSLTDKKRNNLISREYHLLIKRVYCVKRLLWLMPLPVL